MTLSDDDMRKISNLLWREGDQALADRFTKACFDEWLTRRQNDELNELDHFHMQFYGRAMR